MRTNKSEKKSFEFIFLTSILLPHVRKANSVCVKFSVIIGMFNKIFLSYYRTILVSIK